MPQATPAPGQRPWRYLWPILIAAFIARALVALSGDFTVHPDETMQYLEQAHRLVFGNGVMHWEWIFGARSWLVPGFLAGILWICQALGGDAPAIYITAVKLTLCALSLCIPLGMYFATRHLLGETSARLALLLGAFWYELIGMAHKPLTEVLTTSLLFALLALAMSTRPSASPPTAATAATVARAAAGTSGLAGTAAAAALAALATFAVAIRPHYAVAIALVALIPFLRANWTGRLAMLSGATAALGAIILIEYATWGAPLLHSYWVNWKVNIGAIALSIATATELTDYWSHPWWLLLTSGGILGVATLGAVAHLKRCAFFLLLMLAVLVPMMVAGHREYRFIFGAIPFYLILFADLLASGLHIAKPSRTPPPPAQSGQTLCNGG